MTWLAATVSCGLYAILFLSLVSVGMFTVFLIRRARHDPEAGQPRMLAAYAAGATSLCSLMVALINLVHPIGMLPVRDPGVLAIEGLFQALSQKRWDDAIALIHPDRLTEIRRSIPDFGPNTLKALYQPLVGYDNLKIQAVSVQGLYSRTYSVAVDAEEVWPRSSFFMKQVQPLRDFVGDGVVNQERVLAIVVDDLRAYYDVPDRLLPTIRDTLSTRKLESIFSPAFTYELRRDLKAEQQIDLPPKRTQAQELTVRRHFVFNLRVAEDKDQWRIRAGLADPPLIAPYRQKSAWSR
jgi:hypothetical protein